MQRSVTIPFNSGSITFTAGYLDPDTERDLGYLVDDALKRGGEITFGKVIPQLNAYCRGLEQNDTGTTVISNGSSMIEGVESVVVVRVELGYTGVDSDQVNSLLKGTIVRDTLGYLVKMATTPEPHDCAAGDLHEMLASLIARGRGQIVDLGDFSGVDSPFAHQ